jgi:hypothetical protein
MGTESHDPEAFKAKLAAWRENGGLNVTFGGRHGYGTRQDFHEQPSVAQRERDHVRELQAAGVEFDRPRS